MKIQIEIEIVIPNNIYWIKKGLIVVSIGITLII